MPTTRAKRLRTRLPAVPTAVELLLAGKPIPFSDENREALVERLYFGPERLPPDVELRALQILGRWRERRPKNVIKLGV